MIKGSKQKLNGFDIFSIMTYIDRKWRSLCSYIVTCVHVSYGNTLTVLSLREQLNI